MKTFTLTWITFFLITFLTPDTCTAQTHRLLSKIEETKRGNNIWDKVTVMLPNSSYELSKVSYENNTLLVVFNYTQTKGGTQTYFTFNLSDYKIDQEQINEQAAFQVIAKKKNSLLRNFDCPPNCNFSRSSDPPIGTFRCPVYCPF